MNDINPPQASQLPPVAPPPIPSLPEPQKPFSLPKKRPKIMLWVIVAVAAALLLAIVGAYAWYHNALQPRSTQAQNIDFEVAQGSTVEATTTSLEQKGIIKSSFAAQLYVKLTGQANIKSGHYVLSPNQSVAEVIGWLNEGRTNTLRITILPGRSLSELKQDLIKSGLDAAAIDAAYKQAYDHPLLKDKPKSSSLEGYIFPETFFVPRTITPAALLTLSFDEFESRIQKAGLRDKVAKQGLNLHQSIIIASLVSGEVPDYEDRRKVAQVFIKRLREDMPLGSDVSYVYAAKQLGVEPSPAIDSPYNTRKVVGLPPGPVSNFNLSALEAVGDPADTTYLYFVSGDDGVNHFSYTETEHEANVAKYCHKLCN